MKYNGDFKQSWRIYGSFTYSEEVTNDSGKKENKTKIKHPNCDLSGLGWINKNTLRLHINYCGYSDNLYIGDTGGSIGYLEKYKAGDYEIEFDKFNKITSLKFIDLKNEK